MKRIEELRLKALDFHPCNDEFLYKFYKVYSALSDMPFFERYGEAFYKALSGLTPSISENELIVGKTANTLSDDERKEWQEKFCEIAHTASDEAGGGQDSHMAIDYDTLLSIGIDGVVEKIDLYLGDCEDDEKRTFYNTCKKCLQAVKDYSASYSVKACELAKNEKNAERKAELEKIAEICKKVPARPAETFFEAVQSVHFITHCLSFNPFRMGCQQFQLGHPDRYLLPYYLSDIEKGTITDEYARLLLDCLGIQINMRVHNGLSSGYMVGGRDNDGNVVANKLTELCMQVIDDIRLVYPAVGLCYTEEMDDKYLEKACAILSHGRSHPAIFGDDTIAKGLMHYGVDKSNAHNYIHSTCGEITPVGASNVWVASPYTNMAHLLLCVMDKEYDSFDELLETLFARLDQIIEDNFNRQNRMRKSRSENSANPLLSCFVNDCLKNGADIERGGAKYNWIMPSFVGMANLVDSLYVLKTLVFEKKEFTIASLSKILAENFEGHEELRQRILNTIPKYGNDNDDVDSYFGMITDHIIAECAKYKPIHENAHIIPSVFCWIMHTWFGGETGATPDGRCAGFPLGDGSGPCQGREMNGPTASIISSTKWDHHKLIGGVAVNMKFSKSSLGADSVETMKNLVKTFIKRGGFEIQINVVDKEVLEKALVSPEEYKDLVVRIGGYSDYFTRLSSQMQQEVILRTEHQI